MVERPHQACVLEQSGGSEGGRGGQRGAVWAAKGSEMGPLKT